MHGWLGINRFRECHHPPTPVRVRGLEKPWPRTASKYSLTEKGFMQQDDPDDLDENQVQKAYRLHPLGVI